MRKLGAAFVQPPTPVSRTESSSSVQIAEEELFVSSRIESIQLDAAVVRAWGESVNRVTQRMLAGMGTPSASSRPQHSRVKLVETSVAGEGQTLRISHMVLGEAEFVYRDQDAAGAKVFCPSLKKLGAASGTGGASGAKNTTPAASTQKKHDGMPLYRREDLEGADRVAFDELLRLWRVGARSKPARASITDDLVLARMVTGGKRPREEEDLSLADHESAVARAQSALARLADATF